MQAVVLQKKPYRCKSQAVYLPLCRELAALSTHITSILRMWKAKLEYDCTHGSVSPRLFSGAEAAKHRAVATQQKWGQHKRDGGLYWATYKVGLVGGVLHQTLILVLLCDYRDFSLQRLLCFFVTKVLIPNCADSEVPPHSDCSNKLPIALSLH